MEDDLKLNYLQRLSGIIQLYTAAKKDYEDCIPDRTAYQLRLRSLVSIEQISGKQSRYTQQAEAIASQDYHISYQLELIMGIVDALLVDVACGFLVDFSELIRGEIFQDFLDMAEHLCEEGYKDAAAVIAGSTLEEHLRQLCRNYSIDLSHSASDGKNRPKKASQLNEELGKEAYSKFDQKQVTAWLDLRNSAAHGKYNDYTNQQVVQFIDWLKDFTERNPA